MNGNSADNSPPKAPKYNLTFTEYETTIPKTSLPSWSANLINFLIIRK